MSAKRDGTFAHDEYMDAINADTQKALDSDEPWWETDTGLTTTKTEVRKFEPIYPTGNSNPYSSLAKKTADSIKGIPIGGKALIINRMWKGWDAGTYNGEEPPQFDEIDLTEVAKKGSGWKFHLNFDATDEEKVKTVGTFLTALQSHKVISQFKIGHGGGKTSGQPGKEATVYIGHRDKATAVAPVIEEVLGAILDEPEGDQLAHDIEFTFHVMGRFEISRFDSEFHQYGAKGHPLLNKDMSDLLFVRDVPLETQTEVTQRADKVLKDRYGKFYTGSS